MFIMLFVAASDVTCLYAVLQSTEVPNFFIKELKRYLPVSHSMILDSDLAEKAKRVDELQCVYDVLQHRVFPPVFLYTVHKTETKN